MDEKKLEEEYRQTFDNIQAPESLKNNVLEIKAKKHNYKPIIAFASTVAAAIAIYAAVGDYNFAQKDNSGIIEEETVTSKAVETQMPKPPISEDVPITASETEQKDRVFTQENGETKENQKMERRGSMQGEHSDMQNMPQRQMQGEYADMPKMPQRQMQGEYPDMPKMPQKQMQVDKSEMPERRTDFQKSDMPIESAAKNPQMQGENFSSSQFQRSRVIEGNVAMPENSQKQESTEQQSEMRMRKDDVQPVSEEVHKPEEVKQCSTGNEIRPIFHTEEWSNKKYFEYLGTDVVRKIENNSSFSYIGEESNVVSIDGDGKIVNDEWSFAFENSEGGYINVMTTKKNLPNIESMAQENSQIKNINGAKAIISENSGSLSCYVQGKSVAYIIYSSAVSMDEFMRLIANLIF